VEEKEHFREHSPIEAGNSRSSNNAAFLGILCIYKINSFKENEPPNFVFSLPQCLFLIQICPLLTRINECIAKPCSCAEKQKHEFILN